MRCYRVDEDVYQGIYLSETKTGLCVEVGDKRLPLSEELSNSLKAAKKKVVEVLERCLEEESYAGASLDREDIEDLNEVMEVVEPQSIELLYADLDGKGSIVREKERSSDALVLVETMAGENGHISFKSTTFDEVMDFRSNRVRRRYRDQFPPTGVSIISEGKSKQGSRCLLLRMMPSSSFRMERTGALGEAPTVFTVAWKGRKGEDGGSPLRIFHPERRQE